MLVVLFFALLFFLVPVVASFALLGVSIYRYVSAKNKNKQIPGTYSPEEMKKRTAVLIVMAVIGGMLAAIVIGCIALLTGAVAFM